MSEPSTGACSKSSCRAIHAVSERCGQQRVINAEQIAARSKPAGGRGLLRQRRPLFPGCIGRQAGAGKVHLGEKSIASRCPDMSRLRARGRTPQLRRNAGPVPGHAGFPAVPHLPRRGRSGPRVPYASEPASRRRRPGNAPSHSRGPGFAAPPRVPASGRRILRPDTSILALFRAHACPGWRQRLPHANRQVSTIRRIPPARTCPSELMSAPSDCRRAPSAEAPRRTNRRYSSGTSGTAALRRSSASSLETRRSSSVRRRAAHQAPKVLSRRKATMYGSVKSWVTAGSSSAPILSPERFTSSFFLTARTDRPSRERPWPRKSRPASSQAELPASGGVHARIGPRRRDARA